jgi:hypothetical protein
MILAVTKRLKWINEDEAWLCRASFFWKERSKEIFFASFSGHYKINTKNILCFKYINRSLLSLFEKSITKKPWAALKNPGGAAVITQKINDKIKIKH